MKPRKLIGFVADSLKAHLGRDVVEVAKALSQKSDYSEFKLAEAVGREVNETRNLLYKLYNYNLASFTKRKDNKIGWYIHYWTFHEDRVGSFLLNEKTSRLEALKELLSREGKGNGFLCVNACGRVDFDDAFELSFRCRGCGELLNQENSKKNVEAVEEEIAALEKEIEALKKQKAAEGEKRFNENTQLDELEKVEKKIRKAKKA